MSSNIGESITYTSGNHDDIGPPDLRLIHYNDVYHIEPGSRDPVGGIARFKTACDEYRRLPGPAALTFFSGDAFNPSLESSVTKGKHMVGPLNCVNTDVACLGNHDLDFGVEHFQSLAAQCHFPWLCANVLDPALGEDVPLGKCQRTALLTSDNGIRVGVIGLVEREWLDTINVLPPNLDFRDTATTAIELAARLRKEGARMIICLTHQREPNDVKLAKSLPAGTVDLILGGHDHFYGHSIINGIHILRSGTDFKQLSYLECRYRGDSWDFAIRRRDIMAVTAPDPDAVREVERISAGLRPKLEKIIGYTATPLDARFTTVRTRESNMGNFVCDLLQRYYNTDCCIIASGTLRGDQIYPPGPLRVRDIMDCFPFEDPCVVIGVTGAALLAALENAVGKYPAQEGRFPQVSGMRFTFDPRRKEGERVVDVEVAGQPLNREREYTVATRDYMGRGKDGFTTLMLAEEGGSARSIVSEESGLLLSTILRQYFLSLKVVGGWMKHDRHVGECWARVQHDLHAAHPVREPTAKVNASDQPPDGSLSAADTDARARRLHLARKYMRRWWHRAGLRGQPATMDEQDDPDEPGGDVFWTRKIAPRVQGRIRMLGEGNQVSS